MLQDTATNFETVLKVFQYSKLYFICFIFPWCNQSSSGIFYVSGKIQILYFFGKIQSRISKTSSKRCSTFQIVFYSFHFSRLNWAFWKIYTSQKRLSAINPRCWSVLSTRATVTHLHAWQICEPWKLDTKKKNFTCRIAGLHICYAMVPSNCHQDFYADQHHRNQWFKSSL